MPLSTASAAKLFLVISGVANPTVSTIPDMLVHSARPVKNISSVASNPLALPELTTSTLNDNILVIAEPVRTTTDSEKIIGEIRQWGSLKANWDGEGASIPSAESIKDSVSFIKLIADNAANLEPMLLASGNTGLYFNENSLYADIEFLGNNRISYFIKRGDDKHKGVLTFDNEKMPAVFQTLIWS